MSLYEELALSDGEMHPGGSEATRRLIEFGRPYCGLKALDVGSGRGDGLETMHRSGFSTWGIEPSPILAEMAAKRAPYSTVEIGRAESLPFPDGFFDLVILECVLSLTDTSTALKETVRVLRTSGKVLIQDLVGKATGEGCIGGCNTLDEWRNTIEGADLSVTKMTRTDRTVKSYWASAVFHGRPLPCCESGPTSIGEFLCEAMKKTKKG
ncbi:MAG: class I SAM-dependent methyltransferase [Synergistota bacterium]|nr:class I SAM-dependent methyltransferase [Synergistota bacterium]